MSAGVDEIFDIDRIEARLAPCDWAFQRERAAEIDAFWADATARTPELFDGRVLLQHEARIEGRVFHARYVETGYKAFLAWNRMGFPGQPMRNGFAMAALRASDGGFLLGEMGAHTANAGKIYFAAGTPDPGDVQPDGSVDLAGSVVRELAEETGLTVEDVTIGTGWSVVMQPARVAFMRDVRIDLPAAQARELMLSRMALLADQELSDIVIIRSRRDILDNQFRLPVFMQSYLTHMLG